MKLWTVLIRHPLEKNERKVTVSKFHCTAEDKFKAIEMILDQFPSPGSIASAQEENPPWVFGRGYRDNPTPEEKQNAKGMEK